MNKNNFKNNALNFGPKLKEIRENKNFTVRQAAMQANLSASYWSQIENKKREIPTAKTLDKMAKGLNVERNKIFKIAGINSNENDNIKKSIKSLRLKNNLSIDELAKKMQVSSKTMYNWENGIEIPTMGPIQQLSDLFNVSIGYITDGKEEHESQKDIAQMIDDGDYMTFQGKELTDEDKELLKRLLRK